jgi:hypothetical protein
LPFVFFDRPGNGLLRSFPQAVTKLEDARLGWYVIAVLGDPGENACAIRGPAGFRAVEAELYGAETWRLNFVDSSSTTRLLARLPDRGEERTRI